MRSATHGSRPARRAGVAALAIGMGAGVLAATHSPAAADVADLPGLDPTASSVALAVSDDGTVVGSSDQWSPGSPHPFVASGGSFTDLGLPGVATDVAAGTVVGTETLVDDQNGEYPHAFVLPAGDSTPTSLHPDGWDTSTAQQVNDAGQVLVTTREHDDPERATFLWDAGSGFTGIDGPHERVDGADLTDDGAVVGSASSSDVQGSTAFRWTEADGFVELASLGGTVSAATAAAGDVVVGWSSTGAGLEAVRWTPSGDAQSLGRLSAQASRAIDVNDAGQVVGTLEPSTGGTRGFSWTESGGMVDIGSLGGFRTSPRAVLDDGTVVGVSDDADGRERPFAWTAGTGMVDLGLPVQGRVVVIGHDGADRVVGSVTPRGGLERAVVWDLSGIDDVPTTPGAARSLAAAAGDGSVAVAWARPEDNGGAEISSYTVTASPGGASTTVDAAPYGRTDSATLTGLTNGTTYTITVTATNAVGDGAAATTDPVTPTAGALPPRTATTVVDPDRGGQVSTGQVDAAQPYAAQVQVPPGTTGGELTVSQGVVDRVAPASYSFLAQQFDITAPVATAQSPLELTFRADASALGGADPFTVQVFRSEGAGGPVLVPDCTDPTQPGASPDPCVSSRSAPAGGLELRVRTSAASDWNLGVASGGETFPFVGYLDPIKEPPAMNVRRPGATVALKFRLGGDEGLDVLDGRPTSTRISCGDRTTRFGDPAPAAGRLTFQRRTATYVWTWSTPRGWVDTCRVFELDLVDGTTHPALFRFKR